VIESAISRSPAANPACLKIRATAQSGIGPGGTIRPSGTDLQASSKSVGDHSTADSGQPTSAPQNYCVQCAESSRLWFPFDHILILLGPTTLSLTPRLSARCSRSAQPPQPFQRLTDRPVRICLNFSILNPLPPNPLADNCR
jgi:hypothetical protein